MRRVPPVGRRPATPGHILDRARPERTESITTGNVGSRNALHTAIFRRRIGAAVYIAAPDSSLILPEPASFVAVVIDDPALHVEQHIRARLKRIRGPVGNLRIVRIAGTRKRRPSSTHLVGDLLSIR